MLIFHSQRTTTSSVSGRFPSPGSCRLVSLVVGRFADSVLTTRVATPFALARCDPILVGLVSWRRCQVRPDDPFGACARFRSVLVQLPARLAVLEFCTYLRTLYPREIRIAMVVDNFSRT